MTRPIDTVLDRLAQYKLRTNGRDRWRACCPAHGGKNPSALSVGIGAGLVFLGITVLGPILVGPFVGVIGWRLR